MSTLNKVEKYIPGVVVLTFVMLFAAVQHVSAQTIYPQLKSAFVLQFANNVTWANENEIEVFKIGILGNDPETYSALKEVAQKTQRRNKPIEIIRGNAVREMNGVQLLYVSHSKVDEIKDIWSDIEKKNILLVSENCSESQYVMLNMVYDQKSESISFEINKANLIIENFTINPELLLLGGTEVDIRDMYRKMRQMLASEKKIADSQRQKVDEQTKIINEQTNKIEEQNKVTEDLRKRTKELESVIENKEAKLQNIIEKTIRQNDILEAKTQQLEQQKSEFTALERKFGEWEGKIEEKTAELDGLTAEIKKRNETIETQKETINEQRDVLTSKEQLIKARNRLLLLIIAFAIVFLLLGVAIFVAYRLKKQSNKLLEEKVAARTVQLQKSEIRFRSTFEQAAVGIIHFTSINESFKRINKRFLEILGGYVPDDFHTLKYQDIVHPDFRERDLGLFRDIEERKIQNFCVETKLIQKNGQEIWLNLTVSAVVNTKDLLSYFVAVVSDISEQKRVEEELIIARQKAEESDRLKSAFLANMSHEIRTPMNGILGFAELLKDPEMSEDEQQQYIGIIEESGARLLNIINDLIDISKVESGQMELVISETNISKQVEYIQDFFAPEIRAKNMQLVVNNGNIKKDFVLRTDREKLLAILTNLVKNAIKYSDGGTIEIGCEQVKQGMSFYVKDTGIGIPDDRKEAVFERFVQADVYDRKALQGAGLGLAITKSYVEMLGGEIWLESEENKGSIFFFTIKEPKEYVA